MGSGAWSTVSYSAASATRKAGGISDFAYSDTGAGSKGVIHPSLNPRGASRESRDSAEHPQSLAVAVLFDVTGSMRTVPRQLQRKLPALFGLLVDKGYATHPQVLFGAIGDATCDKVPLQIGQFESDNRVENDLGNIVLEGGGGGQMTESYELAMYFMARHTSIDCFEKRNRRGYLFIIGDEIPYESVSRTFASSIVGDDLAEQIPLQEIVSELRRKYHVYYILPAGSSYVGDKSVLGKWRDLLGDQNVIELDNLNAVAETIALTVGLGEGTVDFDKGLRDLDDVGSTAGGVVGKALAPLAHGGSVAASGPNLPATGHSHGVDRL